MVSLKHLTLGALFSTTLLIASGGVTLADDKPLEDGDQKEVIDPLEGLNRVTSGFNRIFRKVVADPLITTYKAVTPDPVEKGIANFAKNLTEPVTAASSLLQGDTDNASKAMGRFVVNTTAGMGGISDTASDLNIKENQEDLGQAAGAAGVEGGAHIVLPILGPTNLRDVTGDVLTTLINPLHTATTAANAGTNYAENKDEIEAMTKDSVDPYIVERNAYEQNRVYKINNGETQFIEIPDFDDEDDDTTSQ
ncbi:MAG: VacJ family lipoprotein [Rhodospirillaceae bacterium]|jgi:phospholipid-binding lipoprotein MlaA|nr:VacJ family lipoprotein [Rhodospirillaceae bacterium]MBT5560711.1 VacJ family lipoprotein [Rhodospirillaceae bacterium]MBT6241130.1 VacJ family lipoprotein [Rhodospirillaceae bacterium]MBT7137114.1 VacJ family lipoprotein [Rhodospirillaceae bacterium]